MNLESFMETVLPDIESALKSMIRNNMPEAYVGVSEMMAYHLGWQDIKNGNIGKGKRIRPSILLMATELCGGEWKNAMPAAVAIELLHNFSLIHDDIEDQSEFRHGRETIWKKWGLAQAINTGDAMFSLSQLAILDLGKIDTEVAYQASKLFNLTCLSLTGGQHLDMLYETKVEISIDEYFQMISGKTAALIAASTELGAIITRSSISNRENLRAFGEALGLAFQAQDDYLGIWGDEVITGKSTSLDLKTGKKTLPVVFAMKQNPSFNHLFNRKPINNTEIFERVRLLEDIGAKDYVKDVVHNYSDLALKSLKLVTHQNDEAFNSLIQLTSQLLIRDK